MASDPRIEAAARAMSALTCWPPDDEAEALLWREQAQEALDAADAVDPLRDRDRAVPTIELAARLSSVRLSHRPDEARVLAHAVFDALNGNDETKEDE